MKKKKRKKVRKLWKDYVVNHYYYCRSCSVIVMLFSSNTFCFDLNICKASVRVMVLIIPVLLLVFFLSTIITLDVLWKLYDRVKHDFVVSVIINFSIITMKTIIYYYNIMSCIDLTTRIHEQLIVHCLALLP